jgi:enterochelin esterase-like enzyme
VIVSTVLLLMLSYGRARVPGDSIRFLPFKDVMLRDCDTGKASTPVPCRSRRQWSEVEIRSRLASQKHAVWAQDEDLTFAIDTPDAAMTVQTGASRIPMGHLPETNVWVLTLHIPGIDSAALSYRFMSPESSPSPSEMWRGKFAPAAVVTSPRIFGRLRYDTIQSAWLREPRAVVSYLPPRTSPARYVIYVADGQAVSDLAPAVDALIAQHRIAPVALVGFASPSALGGTQRNGEYVWGVASDTGVFLAHERWVVEEVVSWAEHVLRVPGTRKARALLGMSSGGAFVAGMGARHPDRFGSVLAVSPTGGLPPFDASPGRQTPSYFFTAGTLEPPVLASEQGMRNLLRAKGARVNEWIVTSGHDQEVWTSTTVPRLIERAFAVKP